MQMMAKALIEQLMRQNQHFIKIKEKMKCSIPLMISVCHFAITIAVLKIIGRKQLKQE